MPAAATGGRGPPGGVPSTCSDALAMDALRLSALGSTVADVSRSGAPTDALATARLYVTVSSASKGSTAVNTPGPVLTNEPGGYTLCPVALPLTVMRTPCMSGRGLPKASASMTRTVALLPTAVPLGPGVTVRLHAAGAAAAGVTLKNSAGAFDRVILDTLVLRWME